MAVDAVTAPHAIMLDPIERHWSELFHLVAPSSPSAEARTSGDALAAHCPISATYRFIGLFASGVQKRTLRWRRRKGPRLAIKLLWSVRIFGCLQAHVANRHVLGSVESNQK